MRYLSSVLAGTMLMCGAAQAQTVTYVTRSGSVGHAISFGSSPLRASSTTQATSRTRSDRHAIEFRASPLRASLPKAYVEVNNSGHTTEGVRRSVVSTTPQTVGPRTEKTTDRRESRSRRAEPKSTPPRPSRHMLRVLALMDNKLNCHQ